MNKLKVYEVIVVELVGNVRAYIIEFTEDDDAMCLVFLTESAERARKRAERYLIKLDIYTGNLDDYEFLVREFKSEI